MQAQFSGLSERILQRFANIETKMGEFASAAYRHDQTFRALGADMIARASGGERVAPLTPNPEKEA